MKPIFVKATNQKPSFNGASPLNFKTFINRTPHKPKVTKNVQRDNQAYEQKSFVKNDCHNLAHLNHRYALPQPFWCDFYAYKCHLREFCWQATKGKQRHDKWKLRYVKKAIYAARRYENHASRRVSPRPQSMFRDLNMIDEVKALVFEYTRIINEMKVFGIDDDSKFRQAREHERRYILYFG